jgi:hypothetical protein
MPAAAGQLRTTRHGMQAAVGQNDMGRPKDARRVSARFFALLVGAGSPGSQAGTGAAPCARAHPWVGGRYVSRDPVQLAITMRPKF